MSINFNVAQAAVPAKVFWINFPSPLLSILKLETQDDVFGICGF
jgi:hypothetical protein